MSSDPTSPVEATIQNRDKPSRETSSTTTRERESRFPPLTTRGRNDDDPRPRYSATALGAWETCPLLFRWRRQNRPGDPGLDDDEGLRVGRAFHDAAAVGYQLEPDDPLSALSTATDVLASGWEAADLAYDSEVLPYPDAVDALERTFDPDAGVLPTFLAGRTLVGIETSFVLDCGDFLLSGRIDLLAADATTITVVDHKTGRRPKHRNQLRGDLQIGVYGIAARALGYETTLLAALWYPLAGERGELVVDEITDETLDVALRRVRGRADEIARTGRTAPATPGPLCSYCEYARSCPVGPDPT